MTRVYPLDFIQDGNVISPSDMKLHDLAVEYASKNLSAMPNFREYHRFWVQCEVDKEGNRVRATGMIAVAPRWDIPLVRFTEGSDPGQLIERVNSFLADKGVTGSEVTIYIARRESAEQRCPRWKKWLKSISARPADRWVATVK
jgi:hypothetical protein